MDTIQKGVLIAHILIALGIVALVLLQRGQGANTGAAFGAGASGTVFGARGSGSFFSRMTAILATAFFASSLTLAYLSSQRNPANETLLQGEPTVEETVDESLPSLEELNEEAAPALEEAADALVDDMPQLDETSAEEIADDVADDLPALDEE